MLKASRSQRAVLTGALVVACAVACDTVLDIQDPTTRPSGVGGEAGEQAGGGPNFAGSNNTATMPGAGEAGMSPVSGGMGGAAGAENTSGSAGQAGEAGQAGAAGGPECEPDAGRCTGAAEKSPEICDASGHWIANPDEANGDCPLLCADGKCTVCKDGDKQCSVCEEGDDTCNQHQAQGCVDGAWQDAGAACSGYCDAGDCVTPPSCDALNTARTTCPGPESCCSSLLVPGGTFKRDFDGTPDYSDDSFSAQVGPFYLDKFEVTVGRMRQFVAAYDQLNLKEGAGKSAHIAGDSGWSTSYPLPADRDALVAQLKCQDTTWSDVTSENNSLPMNCASYDVAYAFCIWDGGRLPTEAEWNFAAAGGDEQRVYPWKAPSVGPAITPEYANYASAAPIAVGSKVLGNGRWGQADLAGNISEWTLDYFGDYPDVCKDCMNATTAAERTERGGAYAMIEDFLVVSFRGYYEPADIQSVLGFRCARDLN